MKNSKSGPTLGQLVALKLAIRGEFWAPLAPKTRSVTRVFGLDLRQWSHLLQATDAPVAGARARLRSLFPCAHPSSLSSCVRRGWLHSPGAILAKREVRGGLYMGTAVYQATPAGRAVLATATRMMANHIADLDDAVVFHQRRAVALVDGGSDDAV